MDARRYGAAIPRQRGIAAVEMAIAAFVLVVLLFALIDISRAIITQQVMINVSRETSNLASRGTPLDIAVDSAVASASPLDIGADGFLILTEVGRDTDGDLVILQQVLEGGEAQASRVGVGLNAPATLPATTTPLPVAGQSVFVTEVFYNSRAITPLGQMLGSSLNEVYYDVAYF